MLTTWAVIRTDDDTAIALFEDMLAAEDYRDFLNEKIKDFSDRYDVMMWIVMDDGAFSCKTEEID